MRGLFVLFLFAALASGQTLDEAVRTLAKRVAAQLGPGEVAHVSERAASPALGPGLAPALAADASRARTLLERALRRPASTDATPVEVILTVSTNLRGPLLVAQIRRGQDATLETAVETAAYVFPPPQQPASRFVVTNRLLWEQDDPILDVAVQGDDMLVLSSSAVERFRRKDGRWELAASFALPVAPPVRDPRGRVALSGDTLAVILPGASCTGQWQPSLSLNCSDAGGDFFLDGEQVRFTPGQNTLETAAQEKFYSVAHSGTLRFAAGEDGRVRITGGAQPATLDGWGSDLAAVPGACNGAPALLASSSGGRDDADSITAYEAFGDSPRAVSDAAPFAGPVTALWPAPGGAVAVVHQLATGRYAAYDLSVDCNR